VALPQASMKASKTGISDAKKPATPKANFEVDSKL
jgi:hypothetical protein